MAARAIPAILVVLLLGAGAAGAFDRGAGADKLPPIEYPNLDLSTWQGRAADAVNKLWGALRAGQVQPTTVTVTGNPGDLTLAHPPSMTAAQIDAVLDQYQSPAKGTGADWVAAGVKYGIDPAYGLAFFIHESSAGTNPSWAGIKPDGTTTNDPGNIVCAGYATCYGRFRDYATWRDGIDDWFKLIKTEYMDGRGHTTIEDVIPVYAPASDNNDEQNYIEEVRAMVAGWRQANMVANGETPKAPVLDVKLSPAGLRKCQYTKSNQYASGFWSGGPNEPVAAWANQYGGLHLGDDFIGAPGDPVFAPFDMVVSQVGAYTDPNDGRYGKNVVARFKHDNVLFYAGHLIDVYVKEGQDVPACTVIGTLGATSFAHTHIKLGAPDAPVPCEGAKPGWDTGCLDPMEYWETH